MTTLTGHESGAAPRPVVMPATRIVDASDIATLPREDLTDGATYAQLWADGRSFAGVMWLEPGAHLAEHTHRRHAHHVWTIDGVIEAMGRPLAAGSYAHVPPGQPHALTAGPEGATIFYLYLEMVPKRSERP